MAFVTCSSADGSDAMIPRVVLGAMIPRVVLGAMIPRVGGFAW